MTCQILKRCALFDQEINAPCNSLGHHFAVAHRATNRHAHKQTRVPRNGSAHVTRVKAVGQKFEKHSHVGCNSVVEVKPTVFFIRPLTDTLGQAEGLGEL